MKQKEIEKIITDARYKVVSIKPYGTFAVLAPDARLYLITVVTKKNAINTQIESLFHRLDDFRHELADVIDDISDKEVELSINMAFICSADAFISDVTLLFLSIHNAQLICYDGTKKSLYERLPKIRVGKKAAEELEAFHGLIKNVVSYIKKNPSKRLSGEPDEDFVEEADYRTGRGFSSPRELAAEVKKYVKGQDHVVDSIAVPFFQHIKSMRNHTTCEIKISFLLAGATGTGKSEILRRFCEIADVPIIRINMADCNPAAWRGLHISDHIAYYINDSSDVERLKYAVLVFNEFDKITHYDSKQTGTSGSDWLIDMQREFLRLYDKDYEILIEKQSAIGVDKYRLPVDNLLVCYDGAFSGINRIVDKRLNKNTQIGFTAPRQSDDNAGITELLAEDLEKWGYMPELLGRIGSFFVMNPMSEDLMYRIMTTASENILNAHINQCAQYGITLQFKEDALRYIARQAMRSSLGFRAVKTILARMMNAVYFDCDRYAGKTVCVDTRFIEQNGALSDNSRR